MDELYKTISAQLRAAYEAQQDEASMSAFLTLLGRLGRDMRDLQRASNLTDFGRQFKPADAAADDPVGEREYAPGTQVYTPEGYLGYIAGHDKRGRAIVNIVFEAAEYPESALTAIPGMEVLLAMQVRDDDD